MNGTPPEQAHPEEIPAAGGADAAVTAMEAAIANRNAVLKSLAERHDQVLKLLDTQREEALKPILRAKERLQEAQAPGRMADLPNSVPLHRDAGVGSEPASIPPRQRLRNTLTHAFTVLSALQGANGTAADAAREQAAAGIADALAELVEAELDKLLQC